jgi:geranylgeranyl pyrophosphate synthase
VIVETEKTNYLNDIEKIKKSFEDFLSAKVKSDFGSLDIFDAIQASVLSGGKRIRPIITILISSLLGLKKKKAFEIAYSIELSHAFTLVHDDIIDKPKERRGEPPIFQRFGQEISLLVGDMLMVYSFIPIFSSPQAVKFFASHMCSVIEGQILDVMWSQKKLDLSLDVEKLVIQIQSKKTASLFKISCLLPLLFSDQKLLEKKGIRKKIENSLKLFALHFGISFQILDDIYDIEEDLRSGSPNILSVLGKEKTLSLFKREINCAHRYLEKFLRLISQLSYRNYDKNSKLLKFLVEDTLNYEKVIQAIS